MCDKAVSGQTSADSCCSHPPMPIGGYWDHAAHRYVPGFTVPWAMLKPHDEQAKRNHSGQDLQRLFERHGMGADEVLAVLDDRPWHGMPDTAAHAELLRRVSAFNANPEHQRSAT
jgi:hypothetical protein